VLTGGEDHALAACFPAGVDLPAPWRSVGRVLDGAGVTVAGRPWTSPGGFDHFRD
jgi:thiamine-monophosphate kinase